MKTMAVDRLIVVLWRGANIYCDSILTDCLHIAYENSKIINMRFHWQVDDDLLIIESDPCRYRLQMCKNTKIELFLLYFPWVSMVRCNSCRTDDVIHHDRRDPVMSLNSFIAKFYWNVNITLTVITH